MVDLFKRSPTFRWLKLIPLKAATPVKCFDMFIGAPDDIEIVERVARRVPVVYVGRHLEAEGIDSVSNDDHLGASLLVRHLVECGHKLIAHIDGGRGAPSTDRHLRSK